MKGEATLLSADLPVLAVIVGADVRITARENGGTEVEIEGWYGL